MYFQWFCFIHIFYLFEFLKMGCDCLCTCKQVRAQDSSEFLPFKMGRGSVLFKRAESLYGGKSYSAVKTIDSLKGESTLVCVMNKPKLSP